MAHWCVPAGARRNTSAATLPTPTHSTFSGKPTGLPASALPELLQILQSIPKAADSDTPTAFSGFDDLAYELNRAIVAEPPATIREGGFIAEGYNEDLDELHTLTKNSATWLSDLELTEREKTGISTLKVGYNRVHGYFIETTKTTSELVPDTYIRRQTLKNAERYITPELKAFEEKALSAQARAIQLEKTLYEQLLAHLKEDLARLRVMVAHLAEIDVLATFAERAQALELSLPQLRSASGCRIDGGWHPVNDNLVGDTTPAYGDFSNDPLAQSTFGVKFGTDYTECMFKLSVGRLDSVV